MSEQQNTHICLWDFTILSSEHCCFLLTCYHNWWGSSFLWKTVQDRWRLQGSSGSSPFLPRTQKEEHWTPSYPCSTLVTDNADRVPVHEDSVNKRDTGADARRWGSASLHWHFQMAHVPVRREVLAGRKGPGSNRNCVGGAKAEGKTNKPE